MQSFGMGIGSQSPPLLIALVTSFFLGSVYSIDVSPIFILVCNQEEHAITPLTKTYAASPAKMEKATISCSSLHCYCEGYGGATCLLYTHPGIWISI